MNFGVVIPLADEGKAQLEFCLSNLRQHYPEVPVRVIDDGVLNLDYAVVCKKHRATYVEGKFLKRIECGGRWWRRTLQEGLATGKPWFIKIDPDTKICRPFDFPPPFPVSGYIEHAGEKTVNIQGGCQAFSRETARAILDSGLLEDRRLTRFRTFCNDPEFLKSWHPQGYLSSDHSLMWILKQLDLPYGDWPEIGSRWKVPPANQDLRYSVTHPHKLPECFCAGVPPWVPLRIITTCMGRLHHLKQTLPLWLKESSVSVTVVDWSCQQGTADWIKQNYNDPRLTVVRKEGETKFNLSKARNFGASQTQRDGLWAFVDADMLIKPGWTDVVRASARPRTYQVAYPLAYSMTGTCVLSPEGFFKAGGYDETISGWGCDDLMFYLALRHNGYRAASWPGEYAESITHTHEERMANYEIKSRWKSNLISNTYYAAVAEWSVLKGLLPDRAQRQAAYVKATLEVEEHNRQHPELGGNWMDGKNWNNGYPVPEPHPHHHKHHHHHHPHHRHHPHPELEPAAPLESGHVGPPAKIKAMPDAATRKFRYDAPHDVPARPSRSLVTVGRPAGLRAPILVSGSALEPFIRSIAMGKTVLSIVNHATVNLGISLLDLAKLGNDYINSVVVPWWGETKQATCVATQQILPNSWAVIIMDDADQQGALGYHDVTPEGLPLVKVFARTAMADGATVTEVFTHEVAEVLCDPDCNLMAADSMGTLYGLETSDPTESMLFSLDGHVVSNIVTPAWFESFHRTGSQRFDHMGRLNNPFELDKGGYAVVIDPTTGQQKHLFGSIEKELLFAKEDRRFHRSEIRKARREYTKGHAFAAYHKAAGGRRPVLTHV
jgi:hypothetical protein